MSGPINDFVFGPNGNVYATTALDELVEISTSTGMVLDVLSSTLANPGPLTFLADGSVVVRDGAGLQRFSESGEFLGVFNSATVNHFTVGPDGNVYATSPTNTILVFDGVTGASLGTFAATPANPSLLAFRPVPEPGSGAVVVAGLACLVAARRPTSP